MKPSVQKNILLQMLSVLFFFSALFTFSDTAESADYRIPNDRAVVWQGNVGVDGGIPLRAVIRNCAVADGTKGDGVADDTAAIRNCIANTKAGTVAYLPAGIYLITGTVTLNKGISLRGAGPDKTIIRSSGNLNELILIGAGWSSGAGINLVSGFTKGSTALTLTDAGAISAGNFVRIDELNDASIPVSPTGDGGTCTWCSRENGARLRAQIVKVTGKTGNTISITPPLFFTFTSDHSPQAQKLKTLTEYAGVEDLTIQNGPNATAGKRINLGFMGASNSWARNIKIDTCGKRCINVAEDNFRVEIRDSYITKCIDRVNSDACYGTLVGSSSSCLIENNIYDGTADSAMLAWTSSGNVVAYNYSHDVHRTFNQATWFWPTTWSHGAHTAYNLWEGNDEAGLIWDFYWGTNSHNTAFRNRLHGRDESITYDSFHQNMAALTIPNRYMNVIGNVLGSKNWSTVYEETSSNYWKTKAVYSVSLLRDEKIKTSLLRHMNFDYATNSVKYCSGIGEPGCQGGEASTTLPPSLYLGSKPTWWGNRIWPGIGPDVQGYAINIPAKDRYLGKGSLIRPASPRLITSK